MNANLHHLEFVGSFDVNYGLPDAFTELWKLTIWQNSLCIMEPGLLSYLRCEVWLTTVCTRCQAQFQVSLKLIPWTDF